MRQFLLVLTLITLSTLAQAEVFECTFSNPSLSVKYDSKTEQLILKKSLIGDPEITDDVSLHLLGSNIVVLKNSKGAQVAKLTYNNNGSDGVSKTQYPFEIELKSLEDEANQGLGGCTSTLIKSVKL
jgi:hypothetical protein